MENTDENRKQSIEVTPSTENIDEFKIREAQTEERNDKSPLTETNEKDIKEKNDISQSDMKRNNSINVKSDHFFKVSNPVTKDGIKSYTLYTVECSLIKNTVYKRYSDFDALRTKLVEKWPGIYIPSIPRKKIVGNLESSFIEMRCRQLNKFANKVLTIPYLFFSEEVKFFLNFDDVEKSLSKIPKEGYDEILMKFKKTFVNIVKENSNNVDEDVNKCSNFMTKVLVKTLTTLKNFKEIIKFAYDKKTQELENSLNLIQFFNDQEKQNLVDFIQDESQLVFFNSKNIELTSRMIDIKEHIKNPFTEMLNWINDEEIEVEVIIEAIKSILEIIEKKKKLIETKEGLEKDIAKLQEGKSSIKNMLSFKSKKEDLIEKENQKSKNEIEIKSIEYILQMVTCLMVESIENFKKEKLENYHKNLSLMAKIQLDNTRLYSEFWNTLANNPNLKEYDN